MLAAAAELMAVIKAVAMSPADPTRAAASEVMVVPLMVVDTVSPTVNPVPPILTLEIWLTVLPSSKPKLAADKPSMLASNQTETLRPSGASNVKPLPLSLATMPCVPL